MVKQNFTEPLAFPFTFDSSLESFKKKSHKFYVFIYFYCISAETL